MSPGFTVLCILFKIIVFFIITLLALFYTRLVITCGQHFHHRIISIRVEVWANKTILAPLLFIEVSVPSQESEQPSLQSQEILNRPVFVLDITKLPNSEQSSKGKVKTYKYINRQNQSTTGKLWKFKWSSICFTAKSDNHY